MFCIEKARQWSLRYATALPQSGLRVNEYNYFKPYYITLLTKRVFSNRKILYRINNII